MRLEKITFRQGYWFVYTKEYGSEKLCHLVWRTLHNGNWPGKGWVIHHINGDPTDDRPENLACLTHKQHKTLHGYIRGQWSDEVKDKIRQTLVGHSVSDDTRKKIASKVLGTHWAIGPDGKRHYSR